MSDRMDNHTLRPLREIRDVQAADSKRLAKVERDIGDLATAVWKMGGVTFKSDARLDNSDVRAEETDDKLAEIESRLAKLEEKA